AVNLRSHVGIPPSVVGNMIAVVEAPGAERPEAVAREVREVVDTIARHHLNLRTDRDFLLRCDEFRLAHLMFRPLDPAHPALLVTNWSSFGMDDITFDGGRPVLCCPSPGPTGFALPWIAVLSKGFGGSGYLCTLSVPTQIADLLRRPDGEVVLHRFRPEPRVGRAAGGGFRSGAPGSRSPAICPHSWFLA